MEKQGIFLAKISFWFKPPIGKSKSYKVHLKKKNVKKNKNAPFIKSKQRNLSGRVQEK